MKRSRPKSDAAARPPEQTLQLKDYNHVALSASLVSISLLKLDFDCRPERMAEGSQIVLSYRRSVLSCQHDGETNLAAAVLQYNVTAKNGRVKTFHCIAQYAVVYSIPEDATPLAATQFCGQIGSFAAYPYFRAVAAQMAWNAGINLPPLPAIASMPVVAKDVEAPVE